MGLRYLIREHVGKGMMVQMFRDGILKLNHLLPDELFKWKKNMCKLGAVEDHMPF
jgi:hypothetical protein